MEETTEILTGVLTKDRIRPFIPFLENEEVTDIDWDGSNLWVNTIYNETKKIPKDRHDVTKEYIDTFVRHVANNQSKHFNKKKHTLEAESEDLNIRVTCLHDSISKTGACVCLRKTTVKPRFTYQNLIDSGYCSKEVLNLLINCVIGKFNIIICGEPEAGKTEFGKFLSMYIPNNEKTITIEDTLEWHYRELKPEAAHIALQVNDDFTYTDALKECMRLNPKRIILTEVRSVEAMNLIEDWNTGAKGITTLHTDDTRKVPDRILNMMPTRLDAERLENNVYENLDVAVLIRRKKTDNGAVKRYIDQVCFFSRENSKNQVTLYVEDGKVITSDIPSDKTKKLKKERIENPLILSSEEIYEKKESKNERKNKD